MPKKVMSLKFSIQGDSGERSFVEVVKGGQGDLSFNEKDVSHKGITIKWEHGSKNDKWLSLCAVGVLRTFENVVTVANRLDKRNIELSIYYLGDKIVLWELQSIKDKEEFVRSRSIWEDYFSSVGNWSPAVTPQSRLVWVDFWGIPLHYWHEDFLTRLGWAMGKPLLIENDSLGRKRVDRGRVLTLIPFGQICLGKIKLATGNQLFTISAVEDETPVNLGWISRHLGLVSVVNSKCLNQGKVVEHFQTLTTSCSCSAGKVASKRQTSNPILKVKMAEEPRLVQVSKQAGKAIGADQLGEGSQALLDHDCFNFQLGNRDRIVANKGQGVLLQKPKWRPRPNLVHNAKLMIGNHNSQERNSRLLVSSSSSFFDEDNEVGRISYFSKFKGESSRGSLILCWEDIW
ncbi:hypothetical protein Q3G72_006436 [Acer saccharum]|nr:hypothetical protein Q3G72_006436 [Acer saccharum]